MSENLIEQRLELFHRQECPYSKRVRDFIESRGLKHLITYHDVGAESGAMEQLKRLTGMQQVPCLSINSKPMLESEDIIAWLRTNLKTSELSPQL